MLIFKCPECDDSTMGFNEATEMWACADCDHEIELEEANTMFEAGDLVGVIKSEDELSEEFPPKKKDDGDDDEEDDDEEDDDEEDDEKDESFNGFSNRVTWTTHLLAQNEYKVHKAVLAGINESEEDDQEAKVQEIVTGLAKTATYAPAFENLDLAEVAWDEIVESLKDSAAEFDTIRTELVEALGTNEALTDEEKKAVTQVFESALTVKLNDLKGNLEEQFAVNLEEATEANFKLLTKQMSGYLDEAIAEWMTENELAIENAIQTEQSRSFMEALKDVFEQHYIEVPEGRYDVLEDMSNALEESNAELEASKAREAALQESLNENVKTGIINKLSEDLTDTQIEKLEQLSGSIDYESETQFESAVLNLRNSFMRTSTNRKDDDTIKPSGNTDLNEDIIDEEIDMNDPIQVAAAAMSRKR